MKTSFILFVVPYGKSRVTKMSDDADLITMETYVPQEKNQLTTNFVYMGQNVKIVHFWLFGSPVGPFNAKI